MDARLIIEPNELNWNANAHYYGVNEAANDQIAQVDVVLIVLPVADIIAKYGKSNID